MLENIFFLKKKNSFLQSYLSKVCVFLLGTKRTPQQDAKLNNNA